MVLQLKVQIKGISKPPVWRKVLVPGNFTFHKLHLVIQYSFGWGGGHLYSFSPFGLGSSPSIEPISGEGRYDQQYVDLDSKKSKISAFLNEKGDKFTYTYDFGDNWDHQITVEAVLPETAKNATLIGGKGKCPPDDCGGVWGYQDFLETINDPKHPEYESMREWAGLGEGKVWDTKELHLECWAALVKQLPDWGF